VARSGRRRLGSLRRQGLREGLAHHQLSCVMDGRMGGDLLNHLAEKPLTCDQNQTVISQKGQPLSRFEVDEGSQPFLLPPVSTAPTLSAQPASAVSDLEFALLKAFCVLLLVMAVGGGRGWEGKGKEKKGLALSLNPCQGSRWVVGEGVAHTMDTASNL
jgi:hypothetical protein